MSNEKPNNPPAYPQNEFSDKLMSHHKRGATMLDLYAKDAPEVPDWFKPRSEFNSNIEWLAAWRFYYATAMLKEREKHI